MGEAIYQVDFAVIKEKIISSPSVQGEYCWLGGPGNDDVKWISFNISGDVSHLEVLEDTFQRSLLEKLMGTGRLLGSYYNFQISKIACYLERQDWGPVYITKTFNDWFVLMQVASEDLFDSLVQQEQRYNIGPGTSSAPPPSSWRICRQSASSSGGAIQGQGDHRTQS